MSYRELVMETARLQLDFLKEGPPDPSLWREHLLTLRELRRADQTLTSDDISSLNNRLDSLHSQVQTLKLRQGLAS